MSIKAALFTELFLTKSMTFIYRQLMGLCGEINIIVITRKLCNENLFPYKNVIEFGKEKLNLLERLSSALEYKFYGAKVTLSKDERSILDNSLKELSLIHAHFGNCGLQLSSFASSKKIPLLVTYHGFDISRLLRYKLYRKHLKRLLTNSYQIAVSEEIKKRLIALGASPQRIFLHHIGIPIDKFRVKERQDLNKKYKLGKKIIFIQVSNLTEKKGHYYSILAFNEFIKKYPNCEYKIIGGGELEQKLRDLVHQLGIQEKVLFLGYKTTDQVIDEMASADIFLHHSITANDGDQEGIPTSLIEAMASGLLAVSTYHSGIPELVVHKETGFLVQEKDKSAYSRMLEEMFTYNLKQITGKARTIVENDFNLDIQNQKLKEIYRVISDEHS